MSNRKRTKKERGVEPEKAREQDLKKPAIREDPDPRHDYGGLPDRDLKKNLGGCG